MRWTIRRKLTLYISLPLLLTYVILLTWDFSRQAADAQRLMQDMALERAHQMAAVFSSRLEGVVHAADAQAAAFASRPNLLPIGIQTTLLGGLRRDDWLSSITVEFIPVEGSPQAPVGYVLRRPGGGGGGGPRVEPSPASTQPPQPPAPPLPGLPRADVLPPGESSTTSDWYSVVAADAKAHWLPPRINPLLGNGPVFSYCAPILEGDKLRGVLAAHVPVSVFGPGRAGQGRRALLSGAAPASALVPRSPATEPATGPGVSPLHEDVARSLSALQPVRYVVLSSDGQLIYRSRTGGSTASGEQPIDRLRRVDLPRLLQAAREAAAGESSVVRIKGLADELDGEKADSVHWVAFAPIPATGWVFASAVAENEIMQPVVHEIERRAGVLLLGTLILGMVVYMVAIRISRPIERMAHVARQVSQGDLNARVAVGRGRDELSQFGAIFNAMVSHIRVQMERIRVESAAREAVESELRIARDIQSDLLPRTFPPFPDHKEFDLHANILPARQVAGDFFDFFFSGDDCLTLVIADVSGKGVPAALLMAVTRTIIRNLATEKLSPIEIVRRTNRLLVEDSRASMFVTMFLAQYQPSTGQLCYVCAGHPAPLSLLPDGSCRSYGQSTAPLVGVSSDWSGVAFDQASRTLEVGESLVLYTDGVTEARNAQGVFFGEQRLSQTLSGHAGDSAEALCRGVIDAVSAHEGDRQTDDITVLVLKRQF